MAVLAELHLYFYPFHLIDACFLHKDIIWNLDCLHPFLSFCLSSLISYHSLHPLHPAAFYLSLGLSSRHNIYLLNLELLCKVFFFVMACFGRSLDSPCTLALLVGFQFAFVLYFSLGGFRGLVSVLVHTTEPEFDYSRPHDVYTNLSLLGVPPPPPRNSGTGLPASGQPLKDCPIPSPLLGEREKC